MDIIIIVRHILYYYFVIVFCLFDIKHNTYFILISTLFYYIIHITLNLTLINDINP